MHLTAFDEPLVRGFLGWPSAPLQELLATIAQIQYDEEPPTNCSQTHELEIRKDLDKLFPGTACENLF
ncbi:MAG: hypothetical protein ACKOX6_12175 [Bdellovibrio sp.]